MTFSLISSLTHGVVTSVLKQMPWARRYNASWSSRYGEALALLVHRGSGQDDWRRLSVKVRSCLCSDWTQVYIYIYIYIRAPNISSSLSNSMPLPKKTLMIPHLGRPQAALYSGSCPPPLPPLNLLHTSFKNTNKAHISTKCQKDFQMMI